MYHATLENRGTNIGSEVRTFYVFDTKEEMENFLLEENPAKNELEENEYLEMIKVYHELSTGISAPDLTIACQFGLL